MLLVLKVRHCAVVDLVPVVAAVGHGVLDMDVGVVAVADDGVAYGSGSWIVADIDSEGGVGVAVYISRRYRRLWCRP